MYKLVSCAITGFILLLTKMIMYVALLIVLLTMLYWWWLERPYNQPCVPVALFSETSAFCRRIIDAMPIVHETFNPPLLWGRNGHIQTFVYGVYDRVDAKRPHGTHCTIRASDGATIIYDIYDRKPPSPIHTARSTTRRQSSALAAAVKPDVTLLICPGIANSSLSPYISTFVYYAQHAGYRCAVLNHLGSDRYNELTAPRIFSYGGTADFELMLIDMLRRHAGTHFILVGFSMGGNVVTKFLGLMSESDRATKHIVGAVSLCQGYDIAKTMYQYMSSWENLGKLYNYLLCLRMRRVITRHRTVLIGHAAMKRNPDSFDKLGRFTSLADLDRIYSMHVQDNAAYATLDDFYRDMSSITNLNTVRDFPVMFVNAQDDPLIPLHLVRDQIELYCRTINHRAMLVVTRHGGHLGFFDSALGSDERHRHVTSVKTCLFQASKFNWLDRLVLQYCDAIVEALDAEGVIEVDLTPLRPSSVRGRRKTRAASDVTLKNNNNDAPDNVTVARHKRRRRRLRKSLLLSATTSQTLPSVSDMVRQGVRISSLQSTNGGTSRSSSRSSSLSSSKTSADGADADDDDDDVNGDDGFEDEDDDDASVATTCGGAGSVSACEEYFLDDEFLRANNSNIRLASGNLIRLATAVSTTNTLQALDEAAEVAPDSYAAAAADGDEACGVFLSPDDDINDRSMQSSPLMMNVAINDDSIDSNSSSTDRNAADEQPEKEAEKAGALLLIDDRSGGADVVAISTTEPQR